jgi:HlyD family secretion protein
MKSSAELDTPALDTPPRRESSPQLAPSPEENRRRRTRRLLTCLTVLLSVVAVGALSLKIASKKAGKPVSNNASLSGNLNRTIRLTGTTEAVRMRSIVAPTLEGEHLGSLTVTKLLAAGTQVHKGDVLAEFDRQAQTREFIDKQAQYEDLVNKVVEEQAKESSARAVDETEMAEAGSSLRKAELEMQKLELFSRIDAEKNEEALEEAKATLQQLRETFDLKRQAARAAIRLLELQRDRAHQVMEHARTNAELMQIHAPLDGVVVLNTIWRQGKMGEVEEGDQVGAGVAFMQVVDPSQMQVRAFVNQEDFLNLQFGQQAKVHLDAYPELVFAGKLEEMAPVATSGDFSSKLRNFAVVFSINGTDPKLMPDLSAAVDMNLTPQAVGAGVFH